MADERLRTAERLWLLQGDGAADPLDVAHQRARLPGLSPSRLDACRRLLAALSDAFDPKHLLTPCCETRVWWGHNHITTAFVASRPLCCRGCDWTSHGRMSKRYSRHIATLELDVSPPPYPLILDTPDGYADPFPNAAGYLRSDAPAPIPTKLLSGVIRHAHERRALVTLPASSLLEFPFHTALTYNALFQNGYINPELTGSDVEHLNG